MTKPTAAFMKPMKPSPELAAIVGEGPFARTEITAKLWTYIKKNELQDKTNRRMIHADDRLRPLFGGKKLVSIFEMARFVQAHTKPITERKHRSVEPKCCPTCGQAVP